MKKILLATALAASFSAASASAAESDYFVKANLGAVKFNKTQGMKSNNDMFFGVGAGVHFMDNVRLDLTFDHFVSPTFKKDGKKVKGDANSLLLNGMVDLFDVSLFKVFAGAGVGTAEVKAKVSGDSVSASNGKTKGKYNIAFAGYLGGSVEFAPGMTGELTYSYRDMGKTKSLNQTSYGFKGNHLSAGIRFDL